MKIYRYLSLFLSITLILLSYHLVYNIIKEFNGEIAINSLFTSYTMVKTPLEQGIISL